MIAQVLPLRTLPRGLDFFTYSVPESLQKTITPGQCVKIPFRSQTLLGIVERVENKIGKDLKPVQEIVNLTPLLGSDYLDFLGKMAKFYGVSAASTIKSALPPLQPNKIHNEEIKDWKIKIQTSGPAEYSWYHSRTEQQAAYSRYEADRLIIIVPQKSDISKVLSALSVARQTECKIWSSDLSIKEERELWFMIRNGECKTMIATRGALWLPLHQSFDRIVIEFEHDQNHKHWDQSPRFTTKDLAKMQVRNFNLAYSEMSYSPSVTSYYFIQEKKYPLIISPVSTLPAPRIIFPDATFERAPIFSPTVSAIHEALENKPNQDIVLLFNLTSAPKNGICRDCSTIINTPLPEFCPNCAGMRMVVLGQTITTVAKWLKKEFSNTEIIPINTITDSIPPSQNARILIGTKAMLSMLDWSTVSLAAILDFTRQAMFAEYLSHEELRHLIRQFQFFLPSDSPLLIQSDTTEHQLLTTIQNDHEWYSSELGNRQNLGYPPYSYLVRYLIPGLTESAALESAKKAIDHLRARLTKNPKNIIIQGPLPASAKNQNKFWTVVMVKIQESDILSASTWCHESFLANTKVDPNPITLTSPH